MKASKFTESQIAFVLKQGEEGTAIAEICQMEKEVRRQLEEKNGRLERIVADVSLDKEMLQDVVRRKLKGLFAAACSLIIFGDLAREHPEHVPRSLIRSEEAPSDTRAVGAIRLRCRSGEGSYGG